MAEELRNIPAHDGKTIYFDFNDARQNGGQKLAILAHGLTGRPREFINVMGMRHLTAAGYDVARIWFYSGNENARRLKDCTVAIHAQDLITLTHHFRDHYSFIGMAGHSYGGLSMLIANPNIDAAAFWDPAYRPGWADTDKDCRIPETPYYTYDNGQNPLMGRTMYDEAVELIANPPEKNAAIFLPPAICIFGNSNDKPGRNRVALFEALGGVKERVDIPEANHEFTIGDTVEQLLAHTIRWFDKFAAK